MIDSPNKDSAENDSSSLRESLEHAKRIARIGGLRLYRFSLTTTARAVSAPRATPAALAPVLQGVATRTYKKFVADDGWPIASHIALSTLTSIFSFLIFVVGLAGFFGNRDIAQQAARLLLEAWPQSIAGPLTVEINNVITRPHGGLLGLGAMLSLFFASSSIEAFRISLDRAYDLKDERSWWQLRLQSILFVGLGAVTLIVFGALIISVQFHWSIAQSLGWPVLAPLEYLGTTLHFVLSTAILFVTLVILHKFLPSGRRSVRMIAPGVVLTLTLWMAFGIGFGVFISGFNANYISTYAGLASIIIILVFLYSLGAIFMFGAELNRILAKRRDYEAVNRRLRDRG